MDEYVCFEFEVYSEDYINAGRASSEIKMYLQQLGIDNITIRKVAIASFEAEMNIVIHSFGGSLILEIDNEKIVLISKDVGPGINDINLALTPGYSTANQRAREMGFGAGMGLPNMKKQADEFFIESNKCGTYLKMIYHLVKR